MRLGEDLSKPYSLPQSKTKNVFILAAIEIVKKQTANVFILITLHIITQIHMLFNANK
jgi:hypothetical protein